MPPSMLNTSLLPNPNSCHFTFNFGCFKTHHQLLHFPLVLVIFSKSTHIFHHQLVLVGVGLVKKWLVQKYAGKPSETPSTGHDLCSKCPPPSRRIRHEVDGGSHPRETLLEVSHGPQEPGDVISDFRKQKSYEIIVKKWNSRINQ